MYHSTPALQPLMPFIDKKAPAKPSHVQASKYGQNGTMLGWGAPKAKNEMDRVRQFVVYRFEKGEKIDLEKAENILTITDGFSYAVPSAPRGTTLVVTALDRLHNESKPVKIKVKK
jgi:hypothetical protein